MLRKLLSLVGTAALVVTIGAIAYCMSNGGSSWERTEMPDGSYALTKYESGSFVEERDYTNQGKLFLRRYSDLQMQSHITEYNPDTGAIIQDTVY